jgi:hypothetical protein
MPDPFPPGPPKVHAPQRLSDAAPADAGLAQQAPVVGGAAATAPQAPGQGARVTAVVSGSGPAAPGQPTTATASQPPPTQPGLARTGADVALLLTFALVAILVGVLLVRLGQPRPLTHHTPQGAP